MRGVFNGKTYELTAPHSNALRMTLLNEINARRQRYGGPLKPPEHLGKLDRHELGPGLTPQVYVFEGTLVAVRCENSNFNNRVWLMEDHRLQAAPVIPL